MQNIVVMLQDEPGTLAKVGETLGAAGVNIHGMCGFPDPPGGTLHLLVEDATTAQQALGDADASVRDVRDVLVVDCADQPGTMGEVTRKLADAGVDVDLIYQATGERLVIGTRDGFERAQKALGL